MGSVLNSRRAIRDPHTWRIREGGSERKNREADDQVPETTRTPKDGRTNSVSARLWGNRLRRVPARHRVIQRRDHFRCRSSTMSKKVCSYLSIIDEHV